MGGFSTVQVVCNHHDNNRDLLMMDRNGETMRLPVGYTLDLVGDPCVIVLRRADGSVAARFTKHVDPEEIRRAAEEDHRRAAGERERDP